MATKWSTCVLPNGKCKPEIKLTDRDAAVRGILLALRYLSREAAWAGLTELARMLEEAELKCDRRADQLRDLS